MPNNHAANNPTVDGDFDLRECLDDCTVSLDVLFYSLYSLCPRDLIL